MSNPKRVQDLSTEQMRQLATLLKQKRHESRGETAILRRSAVAGPLPLSFSQERLWFFDQLGAGGGAYNVPFAVRLAGRLDPEALRRTLEEIVRRHEVLRTTFGQEQGVPFQVVAPAADLPLPWIDLAALPVSARDHELRRLARAEAGRPFDLERGPVLRASLLRLGDAEHVLPLVLHHIASDGWSMGVLVREIAALYGAFLAGQPSPLPELPLQYADYALWQRERFQGEALATELAWWGERLAGLHESLDLPADRQRPRAQSFRGGRVPLAVGPEPAAALGALVQRTRATLFMALLGGFQALLARLTGQTDLVVGSPVANRGHAELAGLVGMFVNTLALRTDLGGDPTFGELLERVRQVTVGAFEHQELPFEKVVEEVRPERDLGRAPVFQVMLVLQSAPVPPLALPGLALSPFPVENATAKFDLTVTFAEEGSGLGGSIEYSADLFEEATAARLAGQLATLLAGAAADPRARLSGLPLLGAAERWQILGEWSDTATLYPIGVTLHELIAIQADRTPGSVAATAEGESLSYRDLLDKSRRLAWHLRSLGIQPDGQVGVLAERSLEMIVGLLSTLLADAAYVPLDPTLPPERLGLLIESAGIDVVLTQERHAKRLPGRGERAVLLDHSNAFHQLPARWARVEGRSPGEAGLAYVLYTSGSTGMPKGVMIPHRGIVNRLLWMQEAYGLTPEDRVLQKTPFSFDVSLWEFFWPLLVGARLVFAKPEGHMDPLYLAELIAREGITTLHFVPSMLQAFLAAPGLEELTTVRKVMASGEALPPELVRRFFQRMPHAELHNLYGPTEASVDVSFWACEPEPAHGLVPIGRPIANHRLHVVGRHLEPQPIGVHGELLLGGPGLARGYLERADLTAVAFVPDPFGTEPGGRLYRTGDLVTYLPDGNLLYLGRIDHQVKVRGFRIEPGEVEAALLRAGAREAAVAVFGEGAERLLVAYVAGGPAPAALRTTLREALPEQMVPAVFVELEVLPRTPNGKVDRKSLPAPDRRSPGGGFKAPRTPEEELLAGIWAGVLGLERIGADDDFFALGGHSLLATRVVSRVRETFQVELPVRALFEKPTVASLAAAIESARQIASGRRVPPLRPGSREGDALLSFAQERLWFLDQLEPGSPAYNMPITLRLRGELRAGVLAAALDAVVERHEVLRTTFIRSASQPVQRIAEHGSWPFSRIDLTTLPESCRAAELRRLAVEEALRPFDFAAGPLVRGTLVRLDGREHAVLLTLHHAVCDGWSLGLLVREVAALYGAFAAGKPSPLPSLPVQYADFAVWQRSWLQGEALAEQLAFWRGGLAGAPGVLELPADRPRPAVPSGRGGSRTERFPAAVSGELAALGRREGLTLFMTLLAAWNVLLFRTAEQTDLVVGTPIANRNRAETEELIGFFTNTLALRTRLTPEASFLDLARSVREKALQAYAHQDLPFERLIEELAPQRSLAHAPLFQVLFALQNTPFEEVTLPGLVLAPLEGERRTAKFDLSLFVAEDGAALSATLEYASDLFDTTTAGRLLERFRTLLEGVAVDPAQRLADLPLLSAAERHAVLTEHNDVPRWQGSPCVHHRVEAWVERTPEAIAVVAADGTELSYAEVDCRADLLARRLRELGAGPDDCVGVCLERSWEGAVTLLAILKAGGCYLPLDPAYPHERLGFMLADAAAPVLVTRDRLAASLPAHGARVLSLDTFPDGWPQEGRGGELPEVGPDHLSYVIYTSGSTGRPKGVALPHRTLANLIDWQIGASAAPAGRTFQFASPSFDVSLQEVFATWAAGGTLVLPAEEVRGDADALLRLLAARRVERLFLPFIALQQLAEVAAGTGELPPLREVVTAGEQLQSTPEVRALFSRLPGCVLRNQYGPSETHVVTEASLWNERRGAVEEWPALPPIGRPIAATKIHLMDPRGVPVPAGVPGEVFLGGAGLARGYLGRPDLTAERFVPDPRGHGGRLYRTGDLARRRPSGELEFLGRIDHQVKIRGFRVELGEIEAALAAHPGVREAVVVARGQGAARRLVACVLPVGGAQELHEPLLAHLRERLPDYMVPAAFVAVERFPLTPSGKVDRRALAASGPELLEAAADGGAPRTQVEEVLAGIFAEVLGLAAVGVRDGFFDLGGHSLLATRVVSRMRDAFGIELPLRTLFEIPNVEGLAHTVEAALRSGVAPAPPIVPVRRDGDLPLSFAQQRLWFIDQLEPGSSLYNVPAALRVEGPLDATVLVRCLGEIVRRHEALRTVFAAPQGAPVQVIQLAEPFQLPLVDLSALPQSAREDQVRPLVAAEASRPFDLGDPRGGPLMRGLLLRLGDRDHAIVLTMHHIASDGWSMGLLVREIAALYPAFAAHWPSPLPELPVQYADFAVWQQSWLHGEVLERQIAFWRQQLAGLPPLLELPTDRPRPAVQSHRGAARPLRLPSGPVREMEALARRNGATLFMVLLAAFQALLARYSGQNDLAVGSPVAGRDRLETEGLIGFFVNTLVLRGDLAGAPTFRELLGRVRETALAAWLHQDVPFEKLVEELAPERSLAHAPLFQAVLVLQNAPVTGLEIEDLRLRPVHLAGATAKFDLTVSFEERDGGLAGQIEYATDLWDATTIDRLGAGFERLLAAAVTGPDVRTTELPLLGAAEQHQLLEWGGVRHEFAAEWTLHGRFAARARQTPEAPALTCGDLTLTYGELHQRSNQLARWLRRQGVGPESRVGLCLDRSLDQVVGILGVLKTGAAYVPLDLGAPRERRAYIMEDADIRIEVGPEEMARLEGVSARDLETWGDASSLAYVIYTSGSTGRPKGTLITHGHVARLFEATEGWFGFDDRDVWTLFHSYAFDFSVWEIWGALLYGGRLVVVPWEVSRSPEPFLDLLVRERVTVLNQTPSAFGQLAQADAERGVVSTGLTDLRLVIFGGEVLDPASLEPWFARHGDTRPQLVNMYGITETTVHVTYRPLFLADARDGHGSVIGVPIADLSLAVLDPSLQPAPIGVPGELVVGGAGLARGYLGRPELTAERFIPDPFGGRQGARLYRSGDLGRFLLNGEVEYLGRLDHQVKIRGFRVEPGEVEAALAAYPTVREAAVVVQGAGADRRLVAFVVGEAGAAELRRHLELRLPAWMVPSAFVSLQVLPLTPNGKVDRRALAVLEAAQERAAAGRVLPRTPVEELLAGIWTEVLGLEAVSINDDFFELGGHSLLATRLVSRIRAAFGVELPLASLFESPTVAGLAAELKAAPVSAGRSQVPPLAPVARSGEAPLSFAQQRLWFLDQLEPESSAYNVPAALRLAGNLDSAALATSLEEIVVRHEALRTTFHQAGEEAVQRIAARGSLPLPLVDLAGLPELRQGAEARWLAAGEAERRFDLARWPLVRATLLRLGREEHVVLLTLHHIVSDGWSLGVLVREVAALYPAFTSGRPSPLPELPVQYADFALWQRGWLQGEALEARLRYWRERLAGAPPALELPTDRPRPAASSGRGGLRTAVLPAEVASGLISFGRREGSTLFMTLFAAFQALLHRYTGQEDLLVGTPIANRNRAEIEDLIGFFVNTLVLRTDVSGDPSFRDLAGRVREEALGAYAHQDLPFERLVEELAPERSLAHTPLFQVMFTLQNAPMGTLELPELALSPFPVATTTAKFDLTLGAVETGAGLSVSLEHSLDLFDDSTADRMLGHFTTLLVAAIEEPGRRALELPLLGSAERHQLLVAWRTAEEPVDQRPCLLHELIEAQASLAPDAVAAVCDGQSLTHGELDRRAGELASRLRRLGVGPEVPVGVLLEPSLDLVVGLLAVLKAGGIYLPLDPDYPRERLSYMLEDSGAPVVLTLKRLAREVPVAPAYSLCLDAPGESAAPPQAASGVAPSNLAYLIYTSGSTGQPKAVGVEHGAAAAHMLAMAKLLGLSPGDRVLQFYSSSFDSSLEQILPALISGAALVLRGSELWESSAFLGKLAELGLTVIDLPSAYWQQWVRECEHSPRPCGLGVRNVSVGGDVMSPEAARLWWRTPLAGVPLFNMYGPTETVVTCTRYRVDPGLAAMPAGAVRIGRPLGGREALVLGREGGLAPMGVPGELHIGGLLARGYRGRPDLTAERFVPNPFSSSPGGRLYRTGDLARWHQEGTLEFLGRIDRQVKIRGFRIEPGEIEAVLEAHSAVREAVVDARGDGAQRHLVAYVRAADGRKQVPDLRAHVRSRLPEHMVPQAFVLLDALPLTPNGKVDRRALALLAPVPEKTGHAGTEQPRSPVEEMLAAIWAEILGHAGVGIRDDFFELGGHSLLATRVVSRVRAVFGVDVTLRALFESRTVERLARTIETAMRSAAPLEAAPIVPTLRDGRLPLSFAQQRLWLIDQLEPGNTAYNIPLAVRLTGALNRPALGATLREIVRRHEALRTTFPPVDGSPVQRIGSVDEFCLPWIDLAGLPEQAREREAMRLVERDAKQPFDLERGPLFRPLSIELASTDHLVLATQHHIVSDGWSMGLFLAEVEALYQAFHEGLPSPLPELPVQYADYAAWQREWLQGEVLEAEIAHWRQHLAGASHILDLPTDRPRPAVWSGRGGRVSIDLPAALSAALHDAAGRWGATPFMLLLAVFGALLARFTGQEDLCIGTPVAGRRDLAIERLIGFFVNTLALRIKLGGDPTFAGAVARTRESALDAYVHQDLPFEKLVEELRPERTLAHSPLFQTFITLQSAPRQALRLPGLELSPVAAESGGTKFDLSLTVVDPGDGRSCIASLAYATDLFDSATARRLLAGYQTLLESLVAGPGRLLSEAVLLSAAELHQIAVEWNDTQAAFAHTGTLHELIEHQAERTPEAPALVWKEEILSHGELDRWANRLAHRLRRAGACPGMRIALFAERSPELVAMTLAVLKSGAAYVALDPEQPRARLEKVLAESSSALLLTTEPPGRLPASSGDVLRLDPRRERREPEDRLRRLAGPHDPAYVVFTSGSTGRPKGIVTPHRGAVGYLQWAMCTHGITAGDTVLQLAPATFDASVRDTLGPLSVGARVVLVPRAVAGDPAALVEQMVRHGVTCLPSVVPSMLRRLAEEAADGMAAAPLRLVLTSGESLHGVDCARVRKAFPGLRIVNQYGPSECTMTSTWHPVAAAEDEQGAVRIGRPLANARLRLLDRSLQPVPLGARGEICIGGPGLALGYLGQPDRTAAAFVPDPLAGEGGERLYRTGDLGRYLPVGTLEFLGRLDHQVKIRGVRVEPAEIESALAGHPEVAAAAVAARCDDARDPRLVAFIVPRNGALLSAAGLRIFLRERLPEPMVPSAFVTLESLPLTPHGKVDRNALPDPGAPAGEAQVTAPQTPTEELIAGIWTDLLGCPRLGIHDDFFDLGGHSLLATRVLSHVRKIFGVELPLRTLFEAPTVARIARAVEEAMREGARGVSAIVPVPRTGELPLSFSQQRLWFLAQIEPDSNAYNIPMAVRLTGALHRGALVAALGTIVERHEALRTTFPAVAGEPVQRIASATGDFELPLVDLGVLPQPAEEARRLAAEEALRPFHLAQGPLLRGALLRLGPGEHIALLTLHHIVFDGWSSGVLIRELAALYAAALTGDPSPLPPLPVQYADFAIWQRSRLADELEDALLPFWRGKLAGAPPVLDLPTDRPRPTLGGKRRGCLLTRMLDRDVMVSLEALGRREGVTLYMILLAAWQVLLYRITGQDDLVTGAPVANRNHADTEGLIGFFVNTLALRGRLLPRESFRELAGRVRNELLETYAYQDLPFERLVEELAPERNPGCTPLFQVVLVLQNVPFDELELPELTLAGIGDLPEAGRAPKFDLTATFSPRGGDLALALELDRNLFDSSTAARLAGWLETLLGALAADPGRAVAGLPLLSEIERHELLVDWSGKAMACPHQATIPELFEAWADLAPEAVAVSFGDMWLSYRALDRQANRLARRLRAMGVGPEVLVGLLAERSPELIVAILAILKAGGAYAPLDPSHPRERLSLLLEDLGAPVVLAQQHLAGLLPDNGPRVLLLESAGAMEESPERLAVRVGPESLAYVMYTSGSTGRPKGVAVVHQGVVRLVRDTGYADFGPQRVWAQLAPAAFDASTLEIWGALLHGGRLAVLPPGTLSLTELGKELSRQGIDSLWLTAGLFHQMVEEGLPGLAAVRQILAGGDVLSPEHVRKALSVLPGCRVINGYGPTENTTFTCCHPMGRPEEVGSPVPLGRPIANTRVWLLDAELDPVPEGVAGELYAGGDGLARGYLNRPELTAERFVPDAWSGEHGARLYRTGDRVRWRAQGTVEFLGRLDQQVKLRGFRVEPGEVEAALAAHPAVREAAVVVRGIGEDRRLMAFVVGEVDAEELRRHLAPRLPAYMVPSAFAFLPALPLTPNGKVDRRALALLEASQGRSAADLALPRTPVEELLAGMWAEMLGLQAVGVDDDFFELGGHSLLATRLVSRIRAALGVDLPLALLFESSTLKGLAAALEACLAGERGLQASPITLVPRNGDAPLSFSQQRLWLLDQLEPGNSAYNIPLAVRLTGALDRAALAATLGEIVRRHEPLRTSFPVVAGGPVQRVGAAESFILPWIDLAGLSAGDRDGEALRLAEEDARKSFNLTEGPLFRPLLVGLAPAEHLVLATQHHIASDGWSMEVFLSEVAALYRTCRAGASSPLPELPVHYADYAIWQRERLQGDFLEAKVAHWRQRLAGAPPVLELPADRARPAVWSGRGARESIALPVELSAALRALARCEEVTPFMLLLAGFGSLLARGSGQEDLCVGTPIAGRGRLEVEGLIGFFTNTLVLRLGLAGNPGLREILARTRSVALDAYTHEELPFEKLVEELRPERSLAHSPLFQAFFTLQNAPRQAFQLPGLELASLAVESGGAKFDLSLTLTDRGESGYAAWLTYASDLFDAATARRLLAGYQALLTALVANPDVRLSDPALLPAPERHQVLVEWNDTAAEPPAARTLHELFASQAARTPDAVALVGDGETLSYGELDRWANRLAWRLRRAGARPGARVALLAGRSPELVAMTLAALKAGAGYVVLDPEQPLVRREQILEDAAPFFLLTREDHLDRLPLFNGEVLFLDPRREPGEPAEALPPLAGPDDLAYMAYTSGSTGRPKGILTPHRGAVGYLCWAVRTHGITAMDTTLQLAAPTFDASVRDTLGPLSVGARVVLVSPAAAGDPASLVECMARHEVTCLPSVVPSMLRRLAAEAGSRRAEVPLRLILTSGESLHVADCARVREVFPGVRIVNQYGPTECTMTSTWHLAAAAEAGSGAVRIGRPLANARIRLMDRSFEPVPLGARGEICIGGPGLAYGYLGQPDRTAQVFVPDPLAGEEGGRLYRTGDLGRYLPDGTLELLGRRDNQVKVRGVRVEPGEIEAALSSHPGVASAVVVARDEAPGDPRLVAYLVARNDAELPAAGLRAFLRERLPEPMVPAAFVTLDTLPLNVHGKVDRRALPDPGAGDANRVFAAPRNRLEETLASLWAEVLRLPRIGIHDSFFELGGHSLSATQLLLRVREELGVDVPLGSVFHAPTVAGLAAAVARRLEPMDNENGSSAPGAEEREEIEI